MSLDSELTRELAALNGHQSSAPVTVTLQAPGQAVVELDFLAVDSMSCAVAELRLHVPALVGADTATLEQWASDLCSRITYLLESIGTLEVDTTASQVLVRSTPPDQQSGSTAYYEILLHNQSSGNFRLGRFRVEAAIPGRQPVELQLTHEVLRKLLADLVDTIP